MQKIFFLFIFLIFIITNIFSINEINDYYDGGLVKKKGTYGFKNPLYNNKFQIFTTAGTKNKLFQFGGKLSLLVDMPELFGFYLYTDVHMVYSNMSSVAGGDLSYYGGFAPGFGESYLGFKHKYFNVKLGFQNIMSSDNIYNHILYDDCSGSFLGLRIDSMLSQFFDVQLMYLILRPNKSTWLNGKPEFDNNLLTQKFRSLDDTTMYDGLYGKSLYFHKFNIRPIPWIRIGFNDSVLFLGENFNPWYAFLPMPYMLTTNTAKYVQNKNGSVYNLTATDSKMGVDFNIGFNGWRIYGEFLLDDANFEYFKFQTPTHPDRLGFDLGLELRGYIFTRYIKMDPVAEYIIKNLYFNLEYAMTSKYLYSRDSNYNYEFVRQEYVGQYDPTQPPSQTDMDRVNRVGNFIGFMYGSNADCLDIGIGWRNDLFNVKEFNAEYQADLYFDSLKKKKLPDRLFKLQLHYRHYRLGDDRNIVVPYYNNEHYAYDLDQFYDSNGTGNPGTNQGTARRTDFLRVVLEEGNIFDINCYSYIFKIGKFVIGAETKFNFNWKTMNPWTQDSATIFTFQWDFGIILSW